MGLTDRISDRAGIPVQEVGALRLIASADASAFLDACLGEGIRVLGLEGFRLLEGRVEPDMNYIADFSELRDPKEAVRQAKDFLESVENPEILFDFVLSNET